MKEYGGWVYIMSSHSRCLYIGVTSDLFGRVQQHKNGTYKGFTQKYKVDQLIYHEWFDDIETAIAREKQLKGWTRAKKIALIEKMNPGWKDLTPSECNPGPSTPVRPTRPGKPTSRSPALRMTEFFAGAPVGLQKKLPCAAPLARE